MKKKIELPRKRIGLEGETSEITRDLQKRRLLGFIKAIHKRLKLEKPDESCVKEKEREVYVELDLTQEQIDKLPIGLKKKLK